MKTTKKWSVFICSIMLSGGAFAEYYISYRDCPPVEYCCNGCEYTYYRSGCSQTVVNIISRAPYRHNSSGGSEQMAEYEWAGDP